jgi:hypothetical protein
MVYSSAGDFFLALASAECLALTPTEC